MINSNDMIIRVFSFLRESEDIPLFNDILKTENKLFDKVDNFLDNGNISKKEYDKFCYLLSEAMFVNQMSSFIMGIKLKEEVDFYVKNID